MAAFSKKGKAQPTPKAQKAPLNHEQEKINQWLQTTKFRKKAFGGVDEADVWKKIEELNRLYDAALSAERARYDALLGLKTRAAARGTQTQDSAPHRDEPLPENQPKCAPAPVQDHAPTVQMHITAEPLTPEESPRKAQPEPDQYDTGEDIFEFLRKEGL